MRSNLAMARSCSRDTDQPPNCQQRYLSLPFSSTFPQITQSRFSIFRRMPNSSLDSRLVFASREWERFSRDGRRGKEEKYRDIAWSRIDERVRMGFQASVPRERASLCPWMEGNGRKVFSIDGWNWRIVPIGRKCKAVFAGNRRIAEEEVACVRARPPLTPFLLSRLIVCPQSRERRELFAEANADYFFAAATKLITGESSRDTTNRPKDWFFSFPFSSSGFFELQREFNARCYSCSNDLSYRRRAISSRELFAFFFSSNLSAIVWKVNRYVNTHRLLRHRVRH